MTNNTQIIQSTIQPINQTLNQSHISDKGINNSSWIKYEKAEKTKSKNLKRK